MNKKTAIQKADEFLADKKKLEMLKGIEDSLNPLSPVVACALEKMVERIRKSRPSATFLSEVKQYWIPIASNFGMWEARYALEDRWFALTDKKNFSLILSLLRKQNRLHQKLFRNITGIVTHYLSEKGVSDFEIIFRKKNIFGIYEKMQRKHQNFNHISDVFAIRIIVKTIPDCYKVLELIQYLWPPYPDRFTDYISDPRPNGYQSIHTTVHGLNGQTVEFQIRTDKMDWIAKYGPANHGGYKRSFES